MLNVLVAVQEVVWALNVSANVVCYSVLCESFREVIIRTCRSLATCGRLGQAGQAVQPAQADQSV